MAAFEAGSIVARVKADLTDFKKSLSDGKKQTEQFGEKVEETGNSVKSMANKTAVALTAIGAGLTVFAKKSTDFTVDYVKESKNLARQIGETTEETSRLLYVTKKMGLEAETAGQMFGVFSKQIVEARSNTGENAIKQQELNNKIEAAKIKIAELTKEMKKNGDASGEISNKIAGLNISLKAMEAELTSAKSPFDKLGISTKNADGSLKSFNQILFETADKFKEMPDGIEKTALSMELFGRSGKDMIKVLNLGSEGIKELEQAADKLGLTLTPETIDKVQKYIKAQKDLKDSTDAVKIAVGTTTAPVLTEFNKRINDVVLSLLNANKGVKDATIGVLAFGGPLLSGAGGATAFAANVGQLNEKLAMTLVRFGAWGIAIAAVLGVVAIIINATGSWGKVMDFLRTVFEMFRPGLEALWTNLQTQLLPALQRLWDLISPMLIPALIGAAAALGGVLYAALWLVINGLNVLVRIISVTVSFISNLIQWGYNVRQMFIDVAGTLLYWIPHAFSTAWGWIQSLQNKFSEIVPAIRNALSGVWDAITSPFRSAFNEVENKINSLKNKMKDLNPLQRHSPSLYDLISKGTGMIKKEYENMYGSIGSMAQQMSAVNLTPSLVSPTSNMDNRVNTQIYGNINIGSQVDSENFLQRLTRNQELVRQGLTPR